MTPSEEQKLLELTEQNNYLLSVICATLLHNTNDDFIQNVIANLIANKMEVNAYAKRQ